MYIWNRLFEAVYSSRQSGIDYLRLSVHLGNVGTYEYFYVALCWGEHGCTQTCRGMCVEVMGHPEGVCSLPSSICAPGIELRSSSFESNSLNHLPAPQNTFKRLVSRSRAAPALLGPHSSPVIRARLVGEASNKAKLTGSLSDCEQPTPLPQNLFSTFP